MQPTKKQLQEMAARFSREYDRLRDADGPAAPWGDALEDAEARFGETRDVVQDIPEFAGAPRVVPPEDELPSGMKVAW